MNRFMRHIGFSTLMLAVFLLTLSSCEHKELYMIDSNLVKVMVNFDYTNVDRTPSAMRVLFYPIKADSVSTDSPLMFDLNGTGGYVNVPVGDYKVLSYNVDNENIIEVNDNDFDNFRLTTSSTQIDVDYNSGGEQSRMRSLFGQNLPKAEGEKEYLLYDEPDWTCRCFCERFHIDPSTSTTRTEDNTQPEQTPSLTLTAEPALYTMEFDVTGVEGLSRASFVRATVSGVAASYSMATGRASSETGMVSFVCKIDVENQIVTGTVRLWGYQPENTDDLQEFLNVYIWSSGGNYYFTNDITDKLTEATEEGSKNRSFHFNIEAHLDLTQGAVGDSGFQPTVGDWGNVYEDIHF